MEAVPQVPQYCGCDIVSQPPEVTVEQVRPEITFARQRVLRAGRTWLEPVLPGDRDRSSGHFAAYVDHEVVGVASVLEEPEDEGPGRGGCAAWRSRPRAGAAARAGAAHPGPGLRRPLRRGLIWCNARITAEGFYEQPGSSPSPIRGTSPTSARTCACTTPRSDSDYLSGTVTPVPVKLGSVTSDALTVNGHVEARRSTGATFAVLATAVLAYAMLQSLVTPVLPTLQHAYNTSQTTVTWLLTANLLSASVFTPILGRIGDKVGKKKLLLSRWPRCRSARCWRRSRPTSSC